MVSIPEVGKEGLQESQRTDDATQVAYACRGSDKASQSCLGRMGKVLQVRVSVASVCESERICTVSPVQVPQQEEAAAVSAEIRRDLLRRTKETRAYSPYKKEVLPMKSVSHGKPCVGNPHARFEEGASASKEPRRNALLHKCNVKNPDTVLITGASSGIGEALAVECAKRGTRNIFFCGRDAERVAAVVRKCEAVAADSVSDKPPVIRGEVLDVTDEEAVRKWIEECNAAAPLEVVFSNAGIGTGIENEENVRRTFATNVGGNLNVVLPTIDIFRRNAAAGVGSSRRQIVITASIAGYAPLSTCPAYAATKAAMKSWALSLRGMLKREGIWVNVICPGFIRSRITDRNTCPMPFFMEADCAVKVMLDRVDRNVGLIAFPWPMRFGVWLMSALPWRVSEFISGMLPEKTSTGRCKGNESKRIAF